MGISNKASRPISAAEGRARKKHVAPLWEGAEYHRCPPGIYDVRCIHVQGPEWLRNHRRWSVRVECGFLTGPGNVSGFLNLGNDPIRPRIGRESKFFRLRCMVNGGPPRRGQEMSPKGVHPYSLSHRRPPRSDAKGSPETVRLARLGRWKVASAISMRTLIKLRSWGATGAGGVSTATSSQVNPLPPRLSLAQHSKPVG